VDLALSEARTKPRCSGLPTSGDMTGHTATGDAWKKKHLAIMEESVLEETVGHIKCQACPAHRPEVPAPRQCPPRPLLHTGRGAALHARRTPLLQMVSLAETCYLAGCVIVLSQLLCANLQTVADQPFVQERAVATDFGKCEAEPCHTQALSKQLQVIDSVRAKESRCVCVCLCVC